MNGKNWYVVHTKPRQEKVAVENLERQGYATYCPQTIQPKRLRQRWQKVMEPLFPRYLFVKLNIGSDNFSSIRSTLGVIGLVRFGNQPAVMPDISIKAIQSQEEESKIGGAMHPHWREGDVLQIMDGPFSGLRGIFQKREGLERVLILLDMLGQQNRFSINIHCLADVHSS